MSDDVNKHGLSRYIPAGVRRVVRQQCGFGCVVCGAAFIQYEHFDPPFKDATEHNSDGIALLCGRCHDPKTHGFWSTEKIAAARKNPITFQAGVARAALDIAEPFTLWLGTSSFQNVSTIVRTQEGETWFRIEGPEVVGGPVRLFADFYDEDGSPSLVIHDNELSVFASTWDVEVEGPKITIHSRQTFLVNDRAPALYSIIRNPGLATALRLMQKQGRDAFYRGDIAAAIVAKGAGEWWRHDPRRPRRIRVRMG